MDKKLLMIPGPIEIAPDVLAEMSSPMEAHYGPKWANFHNETIDMLKEIIKTKSETFIQVGSGHAAIEAVVGSLVEENEEILVLSNGYFGERIATIVESYRAKAVQFKEEWGKALRPEDLEEYLKENAERFKKIMIVHHETSTGISNPVKELVSVAKKYDLLTFVDGVCSIGINDFAMDDWGIDISITASQKGLGAPPGLAIISVNDLAWEMMEKRDTDPKGWYLNLLTMKEFAEKQRNQQPYGITMAVNNVKALHKALLNIKEEGLEKRIERHNKMADFFRDELHKLGLKTAAEAEYATNNITVIYNPQGMNSEEVIKILSEEYKIVIANGLGDFADKAVRIGHMNMGANKNSIVPVINAFKEIINK